METKDIHTMMILEFLDMGDIEIYFLDRDLNQKEKELFRINKLKSSNSREIINNLEKDAKEILYQGSNEYTIQKYLFDQHLREPWKNYCLISTYQKLTKQSKPPSDNILFRCYYILVSDDDQYDEETLQSQTSLIKKIDCNVKNTLDFINDLKEKSSDFLSPNESEILSKKPKFAN